MATPQTSYQDDGPDPEGGQYAENGQYEQSQQGAPAPAMHGKKKRAYAGQAYEFGAGANAALGGQQSGGVGYPGSPPPAVGGYNSFPGAQPQPSYGMPQQPQYGEPNLQTPGVQPAYGQPAYGVQQGYEPPHQGYPAPSAPSVTQQFSQMNIGAGPQSQQPQQAATQMRLNSLQPVDISPQGQPFHVTDLDQPPPPIILPPNVRNSYLIAFGTY